MHFYVPTIPISLARQNTERCPWGKKVCIQLQKSRTLNLCTTMFARQLRKTIFYINTYAKVAYNHFCAQTRAYIVRQGKKYANHCIFAHRHARKKKYANYCVYSRKKVNSKNLFE